MLRSHFLITKKFNSLAKLLIQDFTVSLDREFGNTLDICFQKSSKTVFYLRNRKHFPCFYRVIETRVEVWEKREIAWEHEHEVRVFPRNFEFLPNFHKCFYNSIGTRKKCFLFPLLNSLLKTIKKINLLILITKYCLYFVF